MAAEESLEIIIAAFAADAGADDALRQLDHAHQQALVALENAAIIRKDERAQIRLEAVGAHLVREGIEHGAVIGGVLGLLFPPSLLAGALAGGAVGGLIGTMREGGFDETELRQAAEGLRPNSSALLAVIPQTAAASLSAALHQLGATVAMATLHVDLAQQVRALAATQP